VRLVDKRSLQGKNTGMTDRRDVDVTIPEKIRSFYNYVHSSPERTECTLQADFMSFMLVPNAANRSALDTHLPFLCSSSPGEKKSEAEPLFTREDAVSIFENLSLEFSSQQREGRVTLAEGFDFAMTLSTMQTTWVRSGDGTSAGLDKGESQAAGPSSFSDLLQSKGTRPVFSVNIASSSSSSSSIGMSERKIERVYPSARPLMKTNLPQVEPIESVSSEPEKKRPNPFKSGKDKYIDEGGVFAPKPQGDAGAKISQRVLGKPSAGATTDKQQETESNLPPELAHLDKNLVEKIVADIVHKDQNNTSFDDIAGLEFAKKCVQELICWPICRPDLFTGLRALPKGLLLFGPPGTGTICPVFIFYVSITVNAFIL